MGDDANDVPRPEDIFLRRKPGATGRKSARKAAPALRREPVWPGLFDAVPEEQEPVASPVVTAPRVRKAMRGDASAGPAVEARAVEAKVWSVGDLVRAVRGLVEGSFANVTVDGEISNWRPAASGHCYFTLKDGAAQVAVVMFRREASLLRFKPKDGDAVRLRGQLSLYERRGQMQVIASHMELAGIGAALAAVQELKARLGREGLFARKRPLPAFPRCIGVVTSLQGAALRDIVKVCRRRHAAVNLLIYPAAVQGPNCAREVAAGVAWFSARSGGGDAPGSVDVVMVARGGGSWEDLHGFDDERVVRAIAACSVPVVVGVGHATDTVLADAAADVCAPTPSAAAELVTGAQHRVEERLLRLEERVRRAGRYEILRARQRWSAVSADAALRRVLDGVRRRAQRVDELEFRLQAVQARGLQMRAGRLASLDARLGRQHLAVRAVRQRTEWERAAARLNAAGAAIAQARLQHIDQLWARAEALSPLRVLERGYALVFREDGRLLRAAEETAAGEALTTRLAKGQVRSTVVRTDA
jgi:exodeoxyribonuclease VII large subunit